jgi:cell division septation protein DedD
MRHTFRLATALSALLMVGAPVAAQQQTAGDTTPATITPVAALPAATTPAATTPAESTPPATKATEPTPPASPADEAAAAAESSWKKGRKIVMQYYRPQDKRGLNVFETT